MLVLILRQADNEILYSLKHNNKSPLDRLIMKDLIIKTLYQISISTYPIVLFSVEQSGSVLVTVLS